MIKEVTNENLVKLRELTEKICKDSMKTEYQKVIDDVKNVIEEGEDEIVKSKTSLKKIKCYEKICNKINNILNTITF